jgi:Asp-tRNA(Asn)/Glu-tRNA(Gln) amidotransferase A subunit family amidase
VEDCAIVLSTIYGPDGHDLSLKPTAFNWDAAYDWKKLRVGYFKSEFANVPLATDAPPQQKEARARQDFDGAFATTAMAALKKMGVEFVPVEMPDFPFSAITPVLHAEAAAAFEELTLTHRDALLTSQGAGDWPTQFRLAHLYSAVDYVQAMRARTLAIAAMAKLFSTVDVVVTAGQGTQLAATNLCGHPAVIVPNGVRGADAPAGAVGGQNGGPGTPVSLTFLGALYSDARVAALARAYQEATGFHRLHPPVEKLTATV